MGRLDDGRTVFVPRTAPGDLVELADVRTYKRFARAHVGRIDEPGADRVAPRCPHYEGDDCGGCQLQHLGADAQRRARASFVGDALRRIGRLDVPDPPVLPAEREWAYRAKITVHALDGRLGFHRYDRADQVFDLATCHIAAPELDRLWQAVRRRRALLPGNLETLTLRADREGRLHLIARVQGTDPWTDAKALAAALETDGAAAAIWWEPEGGAPRVLAGGDETYPATVFEQVHPAMGAHVRAHAIERLGDVAGRHVWDLYAGIGETTDALLARGATVESVELDARAVAHAERRAGTPDAARVRRYAARVEQKLPALDAAAAAVVNPPRVGMAAPGVAALARRGPPRLVYISCDPATLARDLVGLTGHYVLEDLMAFDLFPQTAHVETVAVLARR